MEKDELQTKETIKITEKGTAYTHFGEERHSAADYLVASDKTDKDGVRVLILKPRPMEEALKKTKELVKAILKSLGESRSKVLGKLLYDIFIDWHPEAIDRMYDKVVVGKEPVKAIPGCFKLIIGDGRCKGSAEIMLRE